MAATLAVCAGLATPALAAPAMWKATDADSTIWLFGSVHMLPKGADWRTPAFDAALASADEVYFEALLNAEAYTVMPQLILDLGFTPDGLYLSDYLTEDQYASVQAMAQAAGLGPHTLDPQRPWMAMLTLSDLSMRDAIDLTAGVEVVLQGELADDRERAFETADEQMRFFSGLSDETQVEALMEMVDTWETDDGPGLGNLLSGMTVGMFDAWQSGDLDSIGDLIETSGTMSEGELRDVILTDRNKRWVETLVDIMAGSGETMVIVGAAHLVGDDGLPALLEQRGIKVERVQ